MKGGALLILGWLFMSPFALYEGSKQLARAPLGSDGDGNVRWVARALDPTSREVVYDGEKYWYFATAPTVEIRLFRDTQAPVVLTSFEIVDATNIDGADAGQRIDGEPLGLQKTHAFEIWPKDASKPISFRFHGTYQMGEQLADFGGTLSIDSVYPRGPQDADSVKRVPLAQALQVARGGASFSPAQGQDKDIARAKIQRRQRLAEERSERQEKLARQRQAREHERSQNRQAQRAFAQQFDQTRQEIHQEYDARKEQQRLEKARRREQEAEAKRQREAQRQAQREFEQRRREESLLAQRQRADKQQAERQRAEQHQAEQHQAEQHQAEQERLRKKQLIQDQNEKNRARHAKMAPMKINVGLAPSLTPTYEKKGESSNSPQQESFSSATALGVGGECSDGYRPQKACPPGKKCTFRVRCEKDPDYEEKMQKKQQAEAERRKNQRGVAQANQRTSGTSSPQAVGTSSSLSDNKAPDGCLGPADDRRLEGTCIELIKSAWGRHCGNKKSLEVLLRNNCSERIYTKVCLERPGQNPSCGSFGIRPGATNSTWTCEATGTFTHNAVFVSDPMKDWVCSDWN